MSFANFDELVEICWGMEEEQERLNMVKPIMERLNLMEVPIEDSKRWWEEAAKEILRERELFHV
ncbi:hypothetical protein [Bacillus sp. 1NLA3E]|uniref:hypothetical protein n=1 Tax=Bacillus sp. 1NLA3E TaxID=666686 RepID=UPI000247F047|nr:hypothetical protein [Bacillus sp. 1NLA3E]